MTLARRETTLTLKGWKWVRNATVGAFVLAFGIGVSGCGAPSPQDLAWERGMDLPPCEHEDGSGTALGSVHGGGCSWNAGEAGNGYGTSFYVTAEGCYVYRSGMDVCVSVESLKP